MSRGERSTSGNKREKRKHARVSHDGTVEFVTDGRRFSGRAVNVSRSGMQVEVRLPDSFESVRRVTFTLPTTETTISVPFRLVRADDGHRADRVGLEFDFDDDTQRVLIEEFIRDVKERAEAEETADMRRVPRTDCNLSDVTCTRADVTIHSVDNVSTEGLLLTFEGPLAPEEELELRVVLPDNGRRLKLRGRVVYVIAGDIDGRSVAGVRLSPGSEVTEARLRNFISERRSTDALRSVYHSYATSHDGDSEFRITERAAIAELLAETKRRGVTVNTLSERSLRLLECRVSAVADADGGFSLVPHEESGRDAPDEHDGGEQASVYVAFALDGGSYVFKTGGSESAAGGMRLSLPKVVFRSEKRSSRREDHRGEATVRLRPRGAAGAAGTGAAEGRLLDVSRHGFLCELEVPHGSTDAYEVERTVAYETDARLGLGDYGQIRHVTVLEETPTGRRIQLGIEAGVSRTSYAYRRIEPAEWDTDPDVMPEPDVHLESVPVRYRDDADHEIAALLNATRYDVAAPVVIIPPAFGKKKETPAPFVATLLSNFARAGRDVITLRYDGINRPGESYNEAEDPPRGYEMLRYRLSQGLSDLRTTLDYVENNPYFRATKVVLFTASMSSIDARKLLASAERNRVDLWVSLMGVPAAQTTIGSILAGTDIIGNYRLGIPNGVRGMLGHLIDMDTLARDLIEEQYAYLTDARVDMSAVSTPVLWIVGRHDHWVDRDEVADLMSVDGGGARELVEIPTGHNLRNSEDAIRAFKLITSYVHRGLFDAPLSVLDPPRDAVLDMVAGERERLETRRPAAIEEYWRDYLLGADARSEGYDFYRNLSDFREFLALEAKLLGIRDGDRVADLGCGTGLVTEALLERIAADAADGSNLHVQVAAVDLVGEALEKTREKCERVISDAPGLSGCTVEYRIRDLEPNRLLPVRRLVESGGRDIGMLRNRIEGLSSQVVETLEAHLDELLAAVLGGGPVDPAVRQALAARLPEHVLPVVLDLNRAARLVAGRIESADIAPGHRARSGNEHDGDTLRSGDLLFDVLQFGNWSADETTGFADESFDRIIASLFLSYLFNPDYAMEDFYRMLAPGGRLLVSTMRPDSDVSTIFTDYVEEVRARSGEGGDLESAQSMLNEAAALFELEEDGLFRFYTAEELVAMFEHAGFTGMTVHRSLGTPPQAIIVTGEKPPA